ncbi:ABC transporter permease [Lyngbya confervoides]|uniref:ABC transporter permease n=1 Tax=Lyngbya confervoides BDU141951 TaxID=1574623 RepID=A0ABD4T693_9CYAN|nr:ABC transporter permease [Lyngbya confervoides]MCM1983787.1 ABC transporter permease [Lyngbya confervoides BDU141951]
MNRVISQIRKELAQFSRDRLTVALALLLPLAMLLIYGYAIRLESKNISLAVQDWDQTPLSRSYIERLYATGQFVPAPMVGSSPLTALDQGKAQATVVIPLHFARDLRAGSTTVQVLVDGTDVNNARVIQNSLKGVTNFFIQSLPDFSRPEGIVARTRIWFNPGRKESLYIVPGIFAVVLWVFPSMLTAIAVVREKEQGTAIQVYASDLSSMEWLLGKGIAYWIVAVAEAAVVMLVALVLFGLKLQTGPGLLLLGTGIYLGAAVCFGLFVGARTGNQNGAVQGTAIVGFLTSFLLSGFIYRLENIPFPLSLVSNIIPARYYILLTRDAFLRGAGWSGVGIVPLVILGIGLVLFIAATKILKRMEISDS